MLPDTTFPTLNILSTGTFPSWWPPHPPRTLYTPDLSHSLTTCRFTRVLWTACTCIYITRDKHTSSCNTSRSSGFRLPNGCVVLPSTCAKISYTYEIRERDAGVCERCAELRAVNAPRPLPDWAEGRWLFEAGEGEHGISVERLEREAEDIEGMVRRRVEKQNDLRREEVHDRESEVANAWYDFIYLNGPPEETATQDVEFGVVEDDQLHVFRIKKDWTIYSDELPKYGAVQLSDPSWTHLEGVPYSGLCYEFGAPHLTLGAMRSGE